MAEISKGKIEKILNRHFRPGVPKAETRHDNKVTVWSGTKKTYVKHVHQFFKEQKISFNEFSEQRAQEYITNLEASGRYEAATIKLKISALKKFAACLGEKCELKTDVIRHAPSLGFTPEMLKLIRDEMPNKYRLPIRFLEISGLRVSELHTMFKNENGLLAVKGKGGLVRELINEIQYTTIKADSFKGINLETLAREFRRAKNNLGIQVENYRNGLHGIRHTWARNRFEELSKKYGRDTALLQVSKELGHRRKNITLRYLR